MTSTAGMTTAAAPVLTRTHSSTPMPSDCRMTVGEMSTARIRHIAKAVPPHRTARPPVATVRAAAIPDGCGSVPRARSSRKRSTIINAKPTPSAKPASEPTATAVGSVSMTRASSVITPMPAKTVVAPKAVTTNAAIGARRMSRSTRKSSGIAISSARRVLSTMADFSAASMEACPVMWARAGAAMRWRTSCWICGRSLRRTAVSERSIETTIIRAVFEGRRAADAEPVSHAESTRVCGRARSARTRTGPWLSSVVLGPRSRIGVSWLGPN